MEESEEHNSLRQIVEKSDEFIVVKKQANKAPLGVAEPVERRGSVEENSTTKPEVNTQGLAESEGCLARVRAAACRNKEDRFTSLFHHLDYALLERAYEALKRKAAPVRRVWIEKPDGAKRPLGATCIEDKVVQQAMVWILESVYESDFFGFSYCFRPRKSAHNALDALYIALTGKKTSFVLGC